jgi:hypothetical protein
MDKSLMVIIAMIAIGAVVAIVLGVTLSPPTKTSGRTASLQATQPIGGMRYTR